jgi:hypothetical protein
MYAYRGRIVAQVKSPYLPKVREHLKSAGGTAQALAKFLL